MARSVAELIHRQFIKLVNILNYLEL